MTYNQIVISKRIDFIANSVYYYLCFGTSLSGAGMDLPVGRSL